MLKLLSAGVLSLTVWLVLGASSFAAGPEASRAIAPADAKAVRAVVQAQIDALASDDAARAFSFASAEIRQQFGDPAKFMNMVRQGYPMIIRPASVSFFQPVLQTEAQAGAVWQALRVRDHDGKVWRAVYELRQQPDKSWRISGCVIQPDEEGSTT